MIIWGSASGKTNELLTLVKQKNEGSFTITDKMYLYVKDPNEAKYQYLIKKHEKTGLKEHEEAKSLFEYSENMQDDYKNIEESNSDRKHKVWIAFDDKIADMISNKKLSQIVTEIFIRGKKLIISTAFITGSNFAVPKDVRLNCANLFTEKISNKGVSNSHLIIHHIFTLKTSWIFTKMVLQNHIPF